MYHAWLPQHMVVISDILQSRIHYLRNAFNKNGKLYFTRRHKGKQEK